MPPRISIVVPNYNGGKTIEATLRSLLDQNYPNLELIVIDGGSKDNSVEIIKKHQDRIAYWESEKDRGQSHAINKGFARCTGEIVNWLCSDDLLTPGSLQAIADAFAPGDCDVVLGGGEMEFPDDHSRDTVWRTTHEEIINTPQFNRVAQPSCFYRRSLLDRTPVLREEFYYTMDVELWGYFLSKGARWKTIDTVISRSVQDRFNKTRTGNYKVYAELDWTYRHYGDPKRRGPGPRWFRLFLRPWTRFLDKPRGAAGRMFGRAGLNTTLVACNVGKKIFGK